MTGLMRWSRVKGTGSRQWLATACSFVQDSRTGLIMSIVPVDLSSWSEHVKLPLNPGSKRPLARIVLKSKRCEAAPLLSAKKDRIFVLPPKASPSGSFSMIVLYWARCKSI